jgi:hypothetical protein
MRNRRIHAIQARLSESNPLIVAAMQNDLLELIDAGIEFLNRLKRIVRSPASRPAPATARWRARNAILRRRGQLRTHNQPARLAISRLR